MALSIAAPTRASRHGSVMDVQVLCELLQRNGFDSAEFLSGAGISARVLERAGAEITRRQEREFHALFAAATRHQLHIWLEAGRRNSYTAWGDFGMANITAPTLRHIRLLAVHSGNGTGRYPHVQQDRSFAGVAIEFDLDFAPGTPGFLFNVVRSALTGVKLYNDLWGSTFPFAYIQVPAATAPLGLDKHIDVPIRYGDGPLLFVWPIGLDETPLPRGDELLHQQYLRRLDRQSLPDVEVEELVFEVLAHEADTSLGLNEVAAELGLSGRTLQRRLAERGIDFRSLCSSSRLRRAQWMLRTSNVPISKIAFSVGYLEVSSFSHAFRRWAGESPRAYRQRTQADDRRQAIQRTGEHPTMTLMQGSSPHQHLAADLAAKLAVGTSQAG